MFDWARVSKTAVVVFAVVPVMISLSASCRAADDDTIDIAIDLPRKGTACVAPPGTTTSGSAQFFENLIGAKKHIAVPGGGHIINPNAYIPPDFATPPQLPDPSAPAPTAAKKALDGKCGAWDPTPNCWLHAYSNAKLALTASAAMFDDIEGKVTSPQAQPLCTVVASVQLTNSSLVADSFTDPADCPGFGPIAPSHPTICLAWPTTTDKTDWPGLIRKRLRLYAQAQRALAIAVDQFAGTSDDDLRLRKARKKGHK